jgi:hypothetical protein
MSNAKDRKVNTTEPVGKDAGTRLPHERDESPDPTDAPPRRIMRQAARDLEQGLVDTDLHGQRGVETVAPAEPKQAIPDPKLRSKATP